MKEVFNHLVSKGRVTAWLILGTILILTLFDKITGDQASDVIKWLGGLVIVGEAAARKD